MINSIRVYNVGFGDCFLLKIGEKKILVDAGTKKLDNKIKTDIIKDINSEAINGMYGVITHFHVDHYNLLCKLKHNTFTEFYLPNFFTEKEIKLELYVMAILGKNSEAHKFAANLLLTIPELVGSGIIKNGKSIRFVKKGNHILGNIEVLWPDYVHGGNIDTLLMEMESRITDNGIRNKIEEITKQYFGLLDIGNGGIIVQSDSIDVIKRKIKDIENKTGEVKYEGKTKNLSAGLKEKLQDIQNDYSIVMQTEYALDPQRRYYLHLGDVTSRSYEKYIRSQVINKRYVIVKVAHHGTKDYFVKDLPEADMLIISNGRYSNWDISAKYAVWYSHEKFICTNHDGCELFDTIGGNCALYIVKKAS